MRFTRANRHSKARRSEEVDCSRITHVSEAESHTRCEPQELGSRTGVRDPYALWLAQQESARERTEGETIRWVYRYPRVTRPAAPAIAADAAEAASSGVLARS